LSCEISSYTDVHIKIRSMLVQTRVNLGEDFYIVRPNMKMRSNF